MADETISEKCETLYNKLNTFVESEISRDVTPQISNLNSRINALEPNLVRVKEVNGNTSSVSAGGTSTKTFTVPACPSGYNWKYLSTSTGWGTVSSASLSGTTLTVTLLNVSDTSHDISFSGVLMYYPKTIEAEPHIQLTATNPYLLSGEVTDLVVSLVDEFGLPLGGKTVTISDGTSVYNGITNNQGIYTLSDVSVSGYTTFTATYGSVTATCIVHDISDSLFGEVYCLMNDLTTLRANNPLSQSTLSLSSDWKITGEQSLKIVVGSSAKYFGIRTGANYLDITDDIKGKTVRFSAYVNSPKESYLSIYRFVNNSWVSTGSRVVVPSGEQYAEVTFTLESNADYYWFRLEPYTNSGTDGDTIYTDAWTLEVLD